MQGGGDQMESETASPGRIQNDQDPRCDQQERTLGRSDGPLKGLLREETDPGS